DARAPSLYFILRLAYLLPQDANLVVQRILPGLEYLLLPVDCLGNDGVRFRGDQYVGERNLVASVTLGVKASLQRQGLIVADERLLVSRTCPGVVEAQDDLSLLDPVAVTEKDLADYPAFFGLNQIAAAGNHDLSFGDDCRIDRRKHGPCSEAAEKR